MRGDPPFNVFPPIHSKPSTPHARGSTFYSPLFFGCCRVYPACADHIPGMYAHALCLPRMRGDPPQGVHDAVLTSSTRSAIQSAMQRRLRCTCSPRMRGDPPGRTVCETCESRSTPHARGSTAIRVFPDYSALLGLPRMRGDPPKGDTIAERIAGSTPHARGSTYCLSFSPSSQRVYPACAGIHLWILLLLLALPSLRMRIHPISLLPINVAGLPHARIHPNGCPVNCPVIHPACAIHRSVSIDRQNASTPHARITQAPIPAFARAPPHARSTYLENCRRRRDSLPRMRSPDSDKPDQKKRLPRRGIHLWQDHVHPRTEVYPHARIHPNHPLVDHCLRSTPHARGSTPKSWPASGQS